MPVPRSWRKGEIITLPKKKNADWQERRSPGEVASQPGSLSSRRTCRESTWLWFLRQSQVDSHRFAKEMKSNQCARTAKEKRKNDEVPGSPAFLARFPTFFVTPRTGRASPHWHLPPRFAQIEGVGCLPSGPIRNLPPFVSGSFDAFGSSRAFSSLPPVFSGLRHPGVAAFFSRLGSTSGHPPRAGQTPRTGSLPRGVPHPHAGSRGLPGRTRRP